MSPLEQLGPAERAKVVAFLQRVDDGNIQQRWHHQSASWHTLDMTQAALDNPHEWGLEVDKQADWLARRNMISLRVFDDMGKAHRLWRLTAEGLAAVDGRPHIDRDPFENGHSVTVLEAALWYASLGIPVFPMSSNADRKAPVVARGFYSASTSETVVRAMFGSDPGAKGWIVAARTGVVGDVIDLDGQRSVTVLANALSAEEARRLRYCPVARSQRKDGGYHYWVRPNGGGNKQSVLTPEGAEKSGIDVRGLGGYVAMPGGAKKRAWLKDRRLRPGDLEHSLPPMPATITDLQVPREVPTVSPEEIAAMRARLRDTLDHDEIRHRANAAIDTRVGWILDTTSRSGAIWKASKDLQMLTNGGWMDGIDWQSIIFNTGVSVAKCPGKGDLSDADIWHNIKSGIKDAANQIKSLDRSIESLHAHSIKGTKVG